MNINSVSVKAYNAIKKNGSLCYITRKVDEVYNPLTNEYDAEESRIGGYAIASNYDLEKINGTDIKATDVKLMCVLDAVPMVADKITFGANEYSIVSIRKVAPTGSTVLYYEVQCR